MIHTLQLPKSIFEIIEQNEDKIQDILERLLLEKSSISNKKYLSYKIDKFKYFIAYLYNRQMTFAKYYKGISMDQLTKNTFMAHKIQTKLYIDIAISLKLIKRVVSKSYDYLFDELYLNDELLNVELEVKEKKAVDKRINVRHSFDSISFDKKIIEYVNKDILKLNEELKYINENILLVKFKKDLNPLKSKQLSISKKIYQLEGYLKNIETKDYQISVAANNKRRTSLISTIRKDLIDFIRIDNEKCISIDIKNSQPNLFANLISKYDNLSEGVIKFINSCKNSTLYDDIALFNNFKDDNKTARDQGKNFWMTAAYGMCYNKIINKESVIVNKKQLLLVQQFPGLEEFLCDDKSLALKLQLKETEITNEISDKLFTMGYKNITKYDEFIVKESEAEIVMKIIKGIFKEKEMFVQLECKNIKIENKVFTKPDYITILNKAKTMYKYKCFNNIKFLQNQDLIINKCLEEQPQNMQQIETIIKTNIK